MNTTLSDRQSRLRARAAELAERAARLPRALCAACGGVVAEGQGVAVSVSPWNADAAAWARDDDERERTGAVPVRGWTRRHDECATTVGIVRQILGIDVRADVAGIAVIEASRIRGAEILAEHRVGDPLAAPIQRRPRAWSHLTDADRERLSVVVARERGKVEPRRCVEGACAWCGVSTSIGWRSSPETWSDGSQAPLCRDCAVVWDREVTTDREGRQTGVRARGAQRCGRLRRRRPRHPDVLRRRRRRPQRRRHRMDIRAPAARRVARTCPDDVAELPPR